MAADVHYFGIRHHGPGSARRLLAALQALQPACVLVEGPVDAGPLIPLLSHGQMRPPVALLCYDASQPQRASFWPFAEFSPEYQAICWAAEQGVVVQFIDLPAAITLAAPPPEPNADPGTQAENETSAEHGGTNGDHLEDGDVGPGVVTPSPSQPELHQDPFAALAQVAGYEDPESWWTDLFEEQVGSGAVFDAIDEAMSALREGVSAPPDPQEAQREAHMRLAIAKAAKEYSGPVAVVCGAWHVPALRARHTSKDDRALLRGLAKCSIQATWAPWTEPRLAFASGYGAGITAPGWYQHVWQQPEVSRRSLTWLARIALALRGRGHMISTASLIDAERLAVSLAALRNRPGAGFEECRDAAIGVLCHGEGIVWAEIAGPLLLGCRVGSIPAETLLAPLLEDLQRQQKRLRLKAEALERELALDLRSESGLNRSTLLHRLLILDVPWGRLADAGRSRGTFRERWVLCWEPEFAVRLVEKLVFGATIQEAANNALLASMASELGLSRAAELVLSALTAHLEPAARAGIERLDHLAAHTSDCLELLRTLPALAQILRYGVARPTDLTRLQDLLERIVLQVSLTLGHAARNLDPEAAQDLRQAIAVAHGAIELSESLEEAQASWKQALADLLGDPQATPLVAGACAWILYDAGQWKAEAAVHRLQRNLSPGTQLAAASGFFEGFFEGHATQLLYDETLREAVDAWLSGLEDADFMASLPLFRRVLGDLDAMERRRLLDAVIRGAAANLPGLRLAPDSETSWKAWLDRVTPLLTSQPTP
ncbi:MAG: DUF5682 family protein [Planctomycetota bacterium]